MDFKSVIMDQFYLSYFKELEAREIRERKQVLAGENALFMNKLIPPNGFSGIRVFSKTFIPPMSNTKYIWCFNSHADDYRYTKEMNNELGLMIPTPERALVESFLYVHYFDAGLVQEAAYKYMVMNNKDVRKLYEVADALDCPRCLVDFYCGLPVDFLSMIPQEV